MSEDEEDAAFVELRSDWSPTETDLTTREQVLAQAKERAARGDYSGPDVPDRVRESIARAWPIECDSILASLKWNHLEGCWSFTRWGMFIGVEWDGYIHS